MFTPPNHPFVHGVFHEIFTIHFGWENSPYFWKHPYRGLYNPIQNRPLASLQSCTWAAGDIEAQNFESPGDGAWLPTNCVLRVPWIFFVGRNAGAVVFLVFLLRGAQIETERNKEILAQSMI